MRTRFLDPSAIPLLSELLDGNVQWISNRLAATDQSTPRTAQCSPCEDFKGGKMNTGTTQPIQTSNEVEDALLLIVRELLHNDQISPDDDFFLAGGHSMLGTELVIRARRAFGVKVSVHDLFEAGTVARLAAQIEELILEDIDSLSDEEVTRAYGEGRA